MPARRVLDTTAGQGVLSSLLSSRRGASPGRGLVNRRYTEDWVLHRGYQKTRKSEASYWYSDSEDELDNEREREQPPARVGGGHQRNQSNAKTITPSDFQPQPQDSRPFLEPPAQIGADFSDTETRVSEASRAPYRTAPQSIVSFTMETSPKVPKLRSRWADPESDEELKVETPVKSSEQLAPPAAKVEPSVPREALKPMSVNGTGNVSMHNLLDTGAQKSLPVSRSHSPNPRTSIRWNGKNVVIQIPGDLPYGLSEEEGGRPMPLTKAEVEQRFQEWRDQGYEIAITGGDEGGQNRDVFPDEARGKVDISDIFVSIPDRRGASNQWFIFRKRWTTGLMEQSFIFGNEY